MLINSVAGREGNKEQQAEDALFQLSTYLMSAGPATRTKLRMWGRLEADSASVGAKKIPLYWDYSIGPLTIISKQISNVSKKFQKNY